MITLLQRVTSASVEINGDTFSSIQEGLLVLVGIQSHDDEVRTKRMVDRLLGYRVFSDNSGKMNLNVKDVNGGLLLVPQFTLVADTKKGMRPSFHTAASPEQGEYWFNYLVTILQKGYSSVAVGQFGADMQVHLTNNGPVTFWLET